MSDMVKFIGDKMSSRYISEIAGKQHFNVLRDISVLAAKLPEEIGELNFELVKYKAGNGREQPMYTMDEETNPTLEWLNTVWRYPTLDSVNSPLLTVSITAFKSIYMLLC